MDPSRKVGLPSDTWVVLEFAASCEELCVVVQWEAVDCVTRGTRA